METVMVTASLAPRLSAAPSRFYVRPDPEQPFRLTARLVWNESPGKAVGVSINDPRLTVRLEEQGANQIVVLTGEPGYTVPAGRLLQVMVNTDDASVPIFQIPVSAAPGPAGTPSATRTEVLSPQPAPTANARPKPVPAAGQRPPVQPGGAQAPQ